MCPTIAVCHRDRRLCDRRPCARRRCRAAACERPAGWKDRGRRCRWVHREWARQHRRRSRSLWPQGRWRLGNYASTDERKSHRLPDGYAGIYPAGRPYLLRRRLRGRGRHHTREVPRLQKETQRRNHAADLYRWRADRGYGYRDTSKRGQPKRQNELPAGHRLRRGLPARLGDRLYVFDTIFTVQASVVLRPRGGLAGGPECRRRSFSTVFLNYDLLARWVPNPDGRARPADYHLVPVSLFIGTVGAVRCSPSISTATEMRLRGRQQRRAARITDRELFMIGMGLWMGPRRSAGSRCDQGEVGPSRYRHFAADSGLRRQWVRAAVRGAGRPVAHLAVRLS